MHNCSCMVGRCHVVNIDFMMHASQHLTWQLHLCLEKPAPLFRQAGCMLVSVAMFIRNTACHDCIHHMLPMVRHAAHVFDQTSMFPTIPSMMAKVRYHKHTTQMTYKKHTTQAKYEKHTASFPVSWQIPACSRKRQNEKSIP